MAAPPARARADYDYLIKLLLIGDSGRDNKQRLAEIDSKPEDHTIKINKPEDDAEASTSQRSACCGS